MRTRIADELVIYDEELMMLDSQEKILHLFSLIVTVIVKMSEYYPEEPTHLVYVRIGEECE